MKTIEPNEKFGVSGIGRIKFGNHQYSSIVRSIILKIRRFSSHVKRLSKPCSFMRSLSIAICLFIATIFAWAQKSMEGDPSVSRRNYKRSNKVTLARKYDLDPPVALQRVLVISHSEHKHRFNQSGIVIKALLKTKGISRTANGYKHPLGL
jgi:hypothetical protein